MVTVTIHGEHKQVEQGTTFEAIAAEYQKEYDGTIALVSANGKIRELFKKVTRDCEIEFFTLKDSVGHKSYIRAAKMLFLKSMSDVFGADAARKTCVEFSIGRGLYINTLGTVEATRENARRIKDRMGELVEAGTPFLKRSYPLDEAIELFRRKGMEDKVKLFRFRMGSTVNVYEMEGYYDYYYGYMLPNAGYIRWYDVIPYEEGFMLVLPSESRPTTLEPFTESRKLFDTMESAKSWGRTAEPR